MSETLSKTINNIDWSKIFMGIAIAIGFVMQNQANNIQTQNQEEIIKIESSAVSEDKVNEMINAKTNEILHDLVKLQKDDLTFNKEWLLWQKDDASRKHQVEIINLGGPDEE